MTNANSVHQTSRDPKCTTRPTCATHGDFDPIQRLTGHNSNKKSATNAPRISVSCRRCRASDSIQATITFWVEKQKSQPLWRTAHIPTKKSHAWFACEPLSPLVTEDLCDCHMAQNTWSVSSLEKCHRKPAHFVRCTLNQQRPARSQVQA